MSTDAVALVKSRRLGSAATKAILFVLADYADSEWSAFASQARIAAEAEVGERTVRRTLADLEEKGLVARERRHRSDGTRTSDRIVLVRSAIESLPAALAARDEATTGHSRQDYRPLTTGLPATVAEPTGQSLAAHEPSGEPSEEPSVEPLAPKAARDEVWDALVEIFGEAETKTARSLRGRIVKSISGTGADREEVLRRAQAWPYHFPDATLTETALEKHWTTLGRPPLRASPSEVEQHTRELRRAQRNAELEAMERGQLE